MDINQNMIAAGVVWHKCETCGRAWPFPTGGIVARTWRCAVCVTAVELPDKHPLRVRAEKAEAERDEARAMVKRLASSKPDPAWAMKDGVTYRVEADVVALEQRLVSAEAVLREIAARECEITNDPKGCALLQPDDPCGPCRARRWLEG